MREKRFPPPRGLNMKNKRRLSGPLPQYDFGTPRTTRYAFQYLLQMMLRYATYSTHIKSIAVLVRMRTKKFHLRPIDLRYDFGDELAHLGWHHRLEPLTDLNEEHESCWIPSSWTSLHLRSG